MPPETISLDELMGRPGGTPQPSTPPDVIRLDDLTAGRPGRPPPMPTATGDFFPRLERGFVDQARGWMQGLIAAQQGTTPITEGIGGEQNYRRLGELTQFDFGPGYLDEAGQGIRFDPTRHVALFDPRGSMQVYERNQSTDEGALSSLGRMFTLGFLTRPVTRLASSGEMPQSMQLARDFAASDVNPTLPALAQNRVVSTLANVLRDAPLASGPMERGVATTLGQTERAVQRVAGGYGEAMTPADAGRTLTQGVERFARGDGVPSALTPDEIIRLPTRATSFRDKAGALFDRVASLFTDADRTPMTATRAALERLTNQFPNAPALGQILENRLFPQIARAIGGGEEVLPGLRTMPAELTVPELMRLRSRVGAMLGNGGALRDDIPIADLKSLYRAITEDVGAAAQARGPEAARAFERANGYYAAGMNRIENALSAINNLTNEGAFARTAAMGGSNARGSIDGLRAIRRSIPDDEWGDVAAAWIRNAGRPTAGATDTLAAAQFSPATFITNYARLTPEARDVLFSGPNGGALRQSFDALVRVVNAQRNVERMANTSRTGPFVQLMATLTGAATAPYSTGAALGTGWAIAQAMTKPRFVRWLAAAGDLRSPSELPAHVAQLRALGQMEPQARALYSAIADSLSARGPAYAGDEQR